MRRFFLTLLPALLLATVARAQPAALGDIQVTSDAGHFDALRLRSGGLFGYRSPYQYTGVVVQNTHYDQSGWQRDAPAVLALWRNQRPDTLAGTIGEVGLVRVAGRTRVIGDATWSLRPAPHTGIELLASSDLVETQAALDRGTASTFAGASVEQQWGERFTAIGLAGYQHFTDGNARVHLRGRLIWLAIPKQGISAQLRVRRYDSKESDIGGAYFNPDRYDEWQAAVAMRRRYANWIWSGTLAAGREEIDGVQQTTKLVELRAEGSLWKDVHIVVHGSYNRSAGFNGIDGYWYRALGLSVIVPF